MIRLIALFSLAVCMTACNSTKEPLRQIPTGNANVLPLALNDNFSFRKISLFYHDPKVQEATINPVIQFERQRMNYGAVNAVDRAERYGNYFNIWWRAKQPSNLIVRLEYRQQHTGSKVQAKEVAYEDAKGTIETKFTVIGDEYLEEGKVIAWRALLIENGVVVGLRQSFLWN